MQNLNDPSQKILIMGVGNWLMRDEGVGVHAAEQLAHLDIKGVDVVDGGTGGFHLLEYFERYERIILVDATLDGLTPGTIRLIRPKYAQDYPPSMSTHDIGLKDLVCSIQLLGRQPDIHLFVVSIESVQEQGVTMTDKIKAIMPELLNKVIAQAATLRREISQQRA